VLLRTFRLLGLLGLLAVTLPTAALADPEPNDDADWLTWTCKDCKNNTIDLSSHQSKTVYVVVFTPGNADSCTMMRAVAAYVRAHTNKADNVLGFCSDDTGCDAIKLHIRQEEWKKRVDAWNAEQEATKAAAQAAGQPYNAPAMPDFLKQIQDEMNDAEDFDALIAHHLPFKTCQRCDPMWSWLIKRMTNPEGAPRILKVNAQGQVIQTWSAVPNPLSIED
jgi:hypothetical protein